MFPSLWNFSYMTGCEIFERVVFFIDVAEKSNDPGKFLTPQVACNPKQLLTLLGGEGIFFLFSYSFQKKPNENQRTILARTTWNWTNSSEGSRSGTASSSSRELHRVAFTFRMR